MYIHAKIIKEWRQVQYWNMYIFFTFYPQRSLQHFFCNIHGKLMFSISYLPSDPPVGVVSLHDVKVVTNTKTENKSKV